MAVVSVDEARRTDGHDGEPLSPICIVSSDHIAEPHLGTCKTLWGKLASRPRGKMWSGILGNFHALEFQEFCMRTFRLFEGFHVLLHAR